MINQQGQNRNPEELPLSTAHHSLPSLPSSRADTHRPWTCSCSAAAEVRHQPVKKYSSDADERRRTRALLGDAAGSYQRYLQPGGNVYRSAPTVRLFRRPLRSLARVRHRLEAETGSHRLSRFNAACRCDLHQHRRYLMHGGVAGASRMGNSNEARTRLAARLGTCPGSSRARKNANCCRRRRHRRSGTGAGNAFAAAKRS